MRLSGEPFELTTTRTPLSVPVFSFFSSSDAMATFSGSTRFAPCFALFATLTPSELNGVLLRVFSGVTGRIFWCEGSVFVGLTADGVSQCSDVPSRVVTDIFGRTPAFAVSFAKEYYYTAP